MQQPRTRYAPTPSGFLHLGNLYSFIVTATVAQRNKAKILLRIDDMDRARFRSDYLVDIFETLRFFGLPWDEGPVSADDFNANWSQHYRLPLYENALIELKDAGLLYACRCSRSAVQASGIQSGCANNCSSLAIPFDEEGVSWRIHTNEPFIPSSMRDWIIRKKDGQPSYQLCSVIDDQYFSVNLIVRGQDLEDSSIAQTILSAHLPGQPLQTVRFTHHKLITKTDGSKLSKSAGDYSIVQMRKAGYDAPAILGALAKLLGVVHPIHHWTDLASFLDINYLEGS